jgi:hypothetical protein
MKFTILALFVICGIAGAQDESRFRAEFRREGERFKARCVEQKSLFGCGQVFFADHPLHMAVGSIAPQNGFGLGGAFLYSTFRPSWRLRWNADAVISTNGSSRAGVYLKALHIPGMPTTDAQPVISAYAQTISLNKLGFFGLGDSTLEENRSFFGMRQTIAGLNALAPVSEKARLGLYGEFNGRFVSIRDRQGEPSPSIEDLYTDVTAPGLDEQPAFAQFGGGIRMSPIFLDNHVRLNYDVLLQQFVAPANSRFSFRRLKIDLSHEFAIYRTTRSSAPAPTVGPDGNPEADVPASISRDRQGAFGLRVLIWQSFTPAGHEVPFYFQPTLGGSDINGDQLVASLQDYRFRAPNLLSFRGTFEHSIWGPLGVMAMTEVGKVAMTRGELNEGKFRRTFAAGLTLRAGNFPQVVLMLAWGGGEGTHTIAQMNTSLLGASSRPSLH